MKSSAGAGWPEAGLGPVIGPIHYSYERGLLRLPFDRVVCVSDHTLERYLRLRARSPATRVYNGMDYELWDPARHDGDRLRTRYGLENRFVCLFFGRPGFSKGLEVFLDALPAIARAVPEILAFLLVSRDGAYRGRYEAARAKVRRLGLEARVRFTEPVPPGELPAHTCSWRIAWWYPPEARDSDTRRSRPAPWTVPSWPAAPAPCPRWCPDGPSSWSRAIRTALAEGVIRVHRVEVERLPSKRFPPPEHDRRLQKNLPRVDKISWKGFRKEGQRTLNPRMNRPVARFRGGSVRTGIIVLIALNATALVILLAGFDGAGPKTRTSWPFDLVKRLEEAEIIETPRLRPVPAHRPMAPLLFSDHRSIALPDGRRVVLDPAGGRASEWTPRLRESRPGHPPCRRVPPPSEAPGNDAAPERIRPLRFRRSPRGPARRHEDAAQGPRRLASPGPTPRDARLDPAGHARG